VTAALALQPHAEQVQRWPVEGRQILAQFDDVGVVVYQAYRPEIGRFAADNGFFGGAFSLGRMSWIKPNFLWMMYRSAWGTKVGQETVLAVTIARGAFDAILAAAVPSAHDPELHADHGAWQEAVRCSDVRLQWDPDHGPRGEKLSRRAIQLGLRGAMLRRYAREWIVGIEDVSPFVAEQRAVLAREGAALITPREEVYPVSDPAVAARLRLSSTPAAR
jgi:hypothetical protein